MLSLNCLWAIHIGPFLGFPVVWSWLALKCEESSTSSWLLRLGADGVMGEMVGKWQDWKVEHWEEYWQKIRDRERKHFKKVGRWRWMTLRAQPRYGWGVSTELCKKEASVILGRMVSVVSWKQKPHWIRMRANGIWEREREYKPPFKEAKLWNGRERKDCNLKETWIPWDRRDWTW